MMTQHGEQIRRNREGPITNFNNENINLSGKNLLMQHLDKNDTDNFMRLITDPATTWDLDYQDVLGETCLIQAILMQNHEIIQALLERGVNPNIRNCSTKTALMIAADNGYVEGVEFLVNYPRCDVNIFDSLGNTALVLATRNGYEEIVKTLLMREDINMNSVTRGGDTALVLSCAKGFFDIANMLLAHNADPSIPNRSGSTALLFAAQYGNLDIVCKVLPMCGVNQTDTNNTNALMAASGQQIEHYELVKLLLTYKPDINIRTESEGDSALTLAAWNGHTETVKLLLAHGADPNLPKRSGCTALSLAIFRNHIDTVRVLLQDDTTRVDIENVARLTPITLAVNSGSVDMMQLMFQDIRVRASLQLHNVGHFAMVHMIQSQYPHINNMIPLWLREFPSLRITDDMCPVHKREQIREIILDDLRKTFGLYTQLVHSGSFAPVLPRNIRAFIVSLAFGYNIIQLGESRGNIERIIYVLLG